MNTHTPLLLRHPLFAASLLGILFFASSSSALVMRANGPEPIIVQIKESLRLSDDLDNRLNEFASARSQNGLSVLKWWAGSKLLVLLSFPPNFTEQRALAVIGKLQQLPVVERVVAASAFNLHFRSSACADVRPYRCDPRRCAPRPGRGTNRQTGSEDS